MASSTSTRGPIAPLRPLLEPEEIKTSAVPPRPVSQAPRPPHPSISGHEGAESAPALPKDVENAFTKLQKNRQTGAPAPMPPADPAQALAQLQRQREIGAPAPPPPPSKPSGLTTAPIEDVQSRPLSTEVSGPPVPPIVPSTKSITSPLGLGALNLKPGTTPLAPSRTPAPIAIVGGGSLKLKSPDKPMSPSRPPPATLLAAIDANAPKIPTKDSSFVPPPVPMPFPAPPSSAKSVGPSAPPAAPSSRPNTAPKAFSPPAGGPSASYERAFRQWSSPNISTADDASSGNAAPVTFQVYTAQDISAGRAPMRSIPAVPPAPKTSSLAARIGMAAVGGTIFLLTAAAIIAVSTDDPKPAAPAASVAPRAPIPTFTVANDPAPVPSTISIGDPDDAIDELPAKASTSSPTAVVTAKPKPKPTATSTAPTAAAPSSLKGMAPPPNPYGK